MKTIFITSFHIYISRNLFYTDFLPTLLESDKLRIIILVPNDKKRYFEVHFGGPQVVIEGIPFGTLSSIYTLSLLMKRAAKYALNSNSARIERRRKLILDHKWLYFIAISLLATLVSSNRFFRRIMRTIDYYISQNQKDQSPYKFLVKIQMKWLRPAQY